VLLQRYNDVLLRDTLLASDCTDWFVPTFEYLNFKLPREHIYRK